MTVFLIWVGLIVLALWWLGAASFLGWLTDQVAAAWAREEALEEMLKEKEG